MRFAFPLLTAVISIVACATNPVTGDRELALVSESQEIQIGREVAAQADSSVSSRMWP
jgi:hypothetical protein